MSYQVTARKWRPQTFTELVGQEHVARTLQNALRQGRIAHAYLFTGTRGVGKTTTARLLAKALNCEQGPLPEPCNECVLCQAITLGNSLDVLEIDGASNRGIDEIRDLREKIRYAPTRSRYKVYIIDEVHMLTEHAFNALLKTLEEPPPQVVFIFATTEPHKVPITILSRCQRFDFRKVASTEIALCLGKIAAQECIRISSDALYRIARRAEGSLRDAQTLFDQVVAFCGPEVRDEDVGQLLGAAGEEQLLALLDAMLARDTRLVLELFHQMLLQGYETRELCRALLELVRDVIVTKVAPQGHGLVDRSPAERESMQKLGSLTTLEELQTLFELLTTTEMRVRDSAQPIWMLEMSLLKLASLPRLQALSALVARLENLEQRRGWTSGGETPEGLGGADRVREDEPVSEASPAATASTDSEDSGAPSSSAMSAAVEPPVSPAELVRRIIEGASTRALGWILEEYCKVQITDTTLEVVFQGNHRLAHELLHEDETLRTLEQIAHTALGRAIAVRLIDAPAPNGEGALAATSDHPTEENLMSLTRAAIVRDTIELFGGRILDVRRRSVGRDTRERPISEDEMVSQEDVDDE
jgi:DNA polymerase III subunit gamma/tau